MSSSFDRSNDKGAYRDGTPLLNAIFFPVVA